MMTEDQWENCVVLTIALLVVLTLALVGPG
jgi:hypothetical protein